MTTRLWAALCAGMFFLTGVNAQEFSGLARVVADESRIADKGAGVEITLTLSQGVPYRLFTLDEPWRLVLDFQEVDWTGLNAARFLATDRVSDVQFGGYVPGWSRLVLEMVEPLAVHQVGLNVDPVTAQARLGITLVETTAEAFDKNTGAPRDARWDLPTPAPLNGPVVEDEERRVRIVLDPGHGGIDPGAEASVGAQKLEEKDLMLTFARELAEVLLRSGQFDVQLTRNGDYFVSLERRVALAHQARADLFLSLHADSLSQGQAHGSTVYTLSKEASDVASAKLAERQDRSDLLSGTDLSQADDIVTDVLLDLARLETHPRSEALAEAVAGGLAQQGGPMNRRPIRSAGFSVLKSADIPSVLLEVGFLSSPRDLENLTNPKWRQRASQGILNGLLQWRDQDLAQKSLVRQ